MPFSSLAAKSKGAYVALRQVFIFGHVGAIALIKLPAYASDLLCKASKRQAISHYPLCGTLVPWGWFASLVLAAALRSYEAGGYL